MVFSLDDILLSIMALIGFIVGGGISRVLDGIPQWESWHPQLGGQPAPFVKSIAAFVVVAVVLLALVSAYQLLPVLMPQLSPDLQSIIILFAAVLGAYIKKQNGQNAALRKEIDR